MKRFFSLIALLLSVFLTCEAQNHLHFTMDICSTELPYNWNGTNCNIHTTSITPAWFVRAILFPTMDSTSLKKKPLFLLLLKTLSIFKPYTDVTVLSP